MVKFILACISYGFYVHIGGGETCQNQLEFCISCHHLRDVRVAKFIRHLNKIKLHHTKLRNKC